MISIIARGYEYVCGRVGHARPTPCTCTRRTWSVGLAVRVDELRHPVAVAVDVAAADGQRMNAAAAEPAEEHRHVGLVRRSGSRSQLRREEVVDERFRLFIGSERARIHRGVVRRAGFRLLPTYWGESGLSSPLIRVFTTSTNGAFWRPGRPICSPCLPRQRRRKTPAANLAFWGAPECRAGPDGARVAGDPS